MVKNNTGMPSGTSEKLVMPPGPKGSAKPVDNQTVEGQKPPVIPHTNGTPETGTQPVETALPGTEVTPPVPAPQNLVTPGATQVPGPHVMSTATVSGITGKATAPVAPTLQPVPVPEKPSTEMRNVRVSYPEDYTGPRFYENGQIAEVSLPTAEIFVAKGIGTIIE